MLSKDFFSFTARFRFRVLSFISLLPSIYILIYGCYLTFGPIDLYEDGTKNFILENPQ